MSVVGIVCSYDMGYDMIVVLIVEVLKEFVGVVVEELEWEYGVIGLIG